MSKIWLYKKGSEPKMFEENTVPQAELDGWVDSPAKFKRTVDDLTIEELQKLCTQKDIAFAHNSKRETLIKKLRGE